MYLQEIFEQLTAGELQKSPLGGSRDVAKTISPEHYHLIIPAINLAILETHKRLPLRKESVIVVLHEHITMYRMHSDHAFTNTDATNLKTRYLADSVDFPFMDNFLTVDHVKNTGGTTLPLNDLNDLNSVYTPKHDIVQYPYPETGSYMEVVYRAGLPKIPINLPTTPDKYELDMPDFVLTPVLAYTLSRQEIGMIRGENVQSEMQALIKFETACQSIERSSLIRHETFTSTDIRDEGWL